jgi:hypothetical protein
MLPLDIVFFLLVAIWGMIGFIRGFSAETGATIAIVFAMAAEVLFGPAIISTFNKIVGKIFTGATIPLAATVPEGQSAFCYTPSQGQFFFYTFVFALIVFWGYQGETLSLKAELRRVTGSIIGIFIGLVNGWLIAGNLWYFLAKCADYTVPALGINGVGVLNPMSQLLYQLLPLNLITNPVVLLGLLFLLILLRLAK